MEDRNQIIDSKIIEFLRFPLVFSVVLYHSKVLTPDEAITLGFPITSAIVRFLIVPIQNPIYFFISGYCFFYGISDFKFGKYIEKIKKRFWKLFVPYVFWNAVVILFFFLAHEFFPGKINSLFNNVLEWGILDFIKAFINGSGGQPIAYQLWFIRDLMFVCLISPLIFFFAKKLDTLIIVVYLILLLFNIDFPFRSAIFYFGIGGTLSINNHTISSIVSNYSKYKGNLLWVVLTLLYVLSPIGKCHLFGQIYVFTTICSIFSLSVYIISKGFKIIPFLWGSTYFLYLWHGLPAVIVRIAVEKYIPVDSGFAAFADSFLIGIIVVVLGLFLFFALGKYMPNFLSVITGTRKIN